MTRSPSLALALTQSAAASRLSTRTEPGSFSASLALERIASLLNTPPFYGIRMEFLDIEMTKEEQLSFFADNNQRLSRIESVLEQMAIGLDGYKALVASANKKQQNDEDDEDWDEFVE